MWQKRIVTIDKKYCAQNLSLCKDLQLKRHQLLLGKLSSYERMASNVSYASPRLHSLQSRFAAQFD